ncbi:MAG: hypothetical protein ACRDTU_05630 [Micromonosporaceae bacterium]
MATGSTPRRVRVTSPRTRAARPQRITITGEIDAQSKIGEVYMRSLIRTQLRLALLVLAGIGVLLAGLPAMFAVMPQLRQVDLLGLPLPWLLLGVVVHPALVTAAWLYCRQAERTERDFAELVDAEPPTGPPGAP